jgi:hypothetical protein
VTTAARAHTVRKFIPLTPLDEVLGQELRLVGKVWGKYDKIIMIIITVLILREVLCSFTG